MLSLLLKQLPRAGELSGRKQDLSGFPPGIPSSCHVERTDGISGVKLFEGEETSRPMTELSVPERSGGLRPWLGSRVCQVIGASDLQLPGSFFPLSENGNNISSPHLMVGKIKVVWGVFAPRT